MQKGVGGRPDSTVTRRWVEDYRGAAQDRSSGGQSIRTMTVREPPAAMARLRPARQARRTLSAIAVTLVALLAGAPPASAEPGNGAQVTKLEVCFLDPETGRVVCVEEHSVQNVTRTPSGNLSAVVHGHNKSRLADGQGCSTSGSTKSGGHALVKDGVTHELGTSTRGEFTSDCDGPPRECSTRSASHFANGQTQFIRAESDCEAGP